MRPIGALHMSKIRTGWNGWTIWEGGIINISLKVVQLFVKAIIYVQT